ncbi:phosphatase PAP2 family protein [Cohnella lupini]|uniref:phosphatase PAP2 family protein n=1 Tax=Cohnella lupini TaxID=1294267 RepID=UPI0015F25FAF|nr:phosphatase PAP2 family protein [Cohnella lupini]
MSDLDIRLFQFINDNANGNTPLGHAFIRAADWGDWFFALSLVLLLFRNRKMALYGMAAAALTVSVSRQIGKLYWRDRPFAELEEVNQLLIHIESNGFPSDHAAAAAAISVMLLRFSRPIGAIFIGAAAIVGFSRIWVGVHYPGDVLVGFAIGITCACVLFAVLERLRLYELVVGKLRAFAERDSKSHSPSRGGKST